ncbi:MAG TPA: chromosome segregation protein SMC [Aquifex aeolicus]|nr:chromosome segregation protein SMC [Aquifex aeolicus]
MRKKKRKKKEYVRTTVSLPKDIWENLRIESIKTKTPMGELIAKKLKEYERLTKKLNIVSGEVLD